MIRSGNSSKGPRVFLGSTVSRRLKGRVVAEYAMLGKPDLLLIVELPDVKDVIKASIELSELTGISFTSEPAVTVADFDKLFKSIKKK